MRSNLDLSPIVDETMRSLKERIETTEVSLDELINESVSDKISIIKLEKETTYLQEQLSALRMLHLQMAKEVDKDRIISAEKNANTSATIKNIYFILVLQASIVAAVLLWISTR